MTVETVEMLQVHRKRSNLSCKPNIRSAMKSAPNVRFTQCTHKKLLDAGFYCSQLFFKFAVLLAYLVKVFTQLLQLFIGFITAAQGLGGHTHIALRPGFGFMAGNTLQDADRTFFTERLEGTR